MTVLDTPPAQELFGESIAPVNEARLLPPALYTSPQFFEFERRAIFDHEWLCLGRCDQIPNVGDFFAITMAGEPLIAVRDKDASIKVLSAVCRHRGMVLAEGRGSVKSFLCPYHHWVYATDGQLIGCPEMDRAVGFVKSEHRLPSLRVELWNGFIFTTFDSNAPPLAPSLRTLTSLLEHFDLPESTTVAGETYAGLPWNWKVMLENFNDGYHASRLHQGIGDFVPSENARFLPWDDSDNHITRLNYFTHIDGSFNPTCKVLLPVFPGLEEEERWRAMFVLVPPTLGLAVVPDGITYFVINPRAVDAIDIHIGYCFAPAAMDEPLFELLLEQTKAGVNNFNVQDIDADTRVQRGLRSRFQPRGRYSWEEETLQQFNRWLVKRYRAYASAMPLEVLA